MHARKSFDRRPSVSSASRALGLIGASALVALVQCGGDKIDPRFPPRPEGCTVEVFHEIAPTRPSENIGSVSANCTDLVSNEDCLRTLKDEVCKMGGDVVWGVEPQPVIKNGRKHLTGRAAKSKDAKEAAPAPAK